MNKRRSTYCGAKYLLSFRVHSKPNPTLIPLLQVFRVPVEERRHKQLSENAFEDQRQREICQDVMAKTGASIEISFAKDQSLTILITGKPDALAKARRLVLHQLQTQVPSLPSSMSSLSHFYFLTSAKNSVLLTGAHLGPIAKGMKLSLCWWLANQ